MKIQSLFLTVPTLSTITAATVDTIVECVQVLGERGIKVVYSRLGGAPIAVARDAGARDFLRSGLDAWIQIDADISIRALDALSMIAGLESGRAEVIGCSQAFRNIYWDRVFDAARAGTPPQELAAAGGRHCIATVQPPRGFTITIAGSPRHFIEVVRCATACLMTSKDAIRKVWQEATPYRLAAITDLREVFPAHVRELGGEMQWVPEDFGFCARYRELGGSIHVFTGAEVVHTSSFGFTAGRVDDRISPEVLASFEVVG